MSGPLFAGLGLTVLVTGMLRAAFGPAAVVPGLVFGLLATVLQLLAVRALRRGYHGSNTEFVKGFGIGMGLRFGGVVLVLLAVLLDRASFPPLATAFGYLGVVVPLLFLEVRFAR
ncbi:MAG TPA: hypothetical protein VEI47_03310 [Gemmatimonadales bacterium]|nr:hypothetical protein [Gemmatimonadales bacterium]